MIRDIKTDTLLSCLQRIVEMIHAARVWEKLENKVGSRIVMTLGLLEA